MIYEKQTAIGESLAEVLFRDRSLIVATTIKAERNEGAAARLESYRKQVGKQIKKYRERLHLTQDQLAAKTGLLQTHISRLENGLHSPTYMTTEKLAKALGVRMCELDPSFDD